MRVLKKMCSVVLAAAIVCTGINVQPQYVKAEDTADTTNQESVKEYEVGKDVLPYSDEEMYKQIFDINNVVDIDIDMSNEEMAKLENDFEYYESKGAKSDIYRMADVTITITLSSNNETIRYFIPETGIRMKGNTTRNKFYDTQKNTVYDMLHLKLAFGETFEKTDDGYGVNEYYINDETAENPNNVKAWDKEAKSIRKKRTFAGLEKVDIKWNSNYDNTYLREYYAYEMYRSEGIIAPHMNLTSLELGDKEKNNQYHMGVYSIHECIDKDFMDRSLAEADRGGDLYKAGWAYVDSISSYNGANFTKQTTVGISDDRAGTDYTYDLKTNKKTSDFSSINNMINVLASNPSKEDFAKVVDVDYFVKYAATAYFVGNPDDLKNNINNYYVYFYPSTSAKAGQAIIIPYDYDRCFGVTVGYNPDGTGMTGFSPYSDKGAATRNDNPIYDYSVVPGGYYFDEYRAALEKVVANELFTPEAFEKVYKIAEKNYSSKAKLGENLVLIDSKKPKMTGEDRMSRFYFSLEDDSDTESYNSSTSNITFKNYVTTLKEYYNSEKNYVVVEDGYYVVCGQSNWKEIPEYAMTEKSDNTYTFTWDCKEEDTFSVIGTNGDIFRYKALTGSIPEGVGTNIYGSITVKPGQYEITLNTAKMTLSIKNLNEAEKVKIVFNGNGGKVGSSSSYSVSVKSGSKLGTLKTAKRQGYLFAGWYTKKSGGSKISASTKATKAVTYYAHWNKATAGSVKVAGIKSKKQGAFELVIKKTQGAQGYEVAYADNSSMKKAVKKNITSLKYSASKLKSGKTYYVTVRAYVKDSTGKKVYGKVTKTKVAVK